MNFHDAFLAAVGIFLVHSRNTQGTTNQLLNNELNNTGVIPSTAFQDYDSYEYSGSASQSSGSGLNYPSTFTGDYYDPWLFDNGSYDGAGDTFDYQCEDGIGGISATDFCDAFKHCSDGSDEPPLRNFQVKYEANTTFCKSLGWYKYICVLPHHLVPLKHLLCADSDECSSDEFACHDGSQCVKQLKFCDGTKDCRDDSDEPLRNNSVVYGDNVKLCKGLNLNPNICILPPQLVPIKNLICAESDECLPIEFPCQDGSGCTNAWEFCDGIKNCKDGSDEPLRFSHVDYGDNATICKGLGFVTNICILPPHLAPKKHYFCQKRDDCSPDEFTCKDGTICLPSEYGLCDGIKGCRDMSDEVPMEYDFVGRVCLPNRNYYTYYTNFIETCKVTKRRICDGFYNCEDGVDECLCDEDSRNIFVDSRCFRCLSAPSHVIPISRFCDNAFDCPDLSDECLCKSSQRPVICSQIEWGEMIENMTLNCLPKLETAKTIPTSSICDGRRDCDDGMDELFCRKGNEEGMIYSKEGVMYSLWSTACNADDHDDYENSFDDSESCDGVAYCKELTDEIDCKHRFYCTDDPLPNIPLEAACDKADDCDNGQDEANCSYFHCGDGGNIKYLDQNQVCDGIRNCLGGSDECQPGCIDSAFSNEQSMINNKVILAFVWIFGGVALLGCSSVFLVTLREIANLNASVMRETRSRKNALVNKALILSLSISDLLVAIYVFAICIKSVEFEGEYCLVDREWRSSIACSVLGTLLLIGSEQSVFTMVLITIQRVYSIWRPTVIPNVKIAWAGIAVTWIISIGFGVIPTIPSAADYFVDNVTFMNSPIFTAVGLNEVDHLNSWLFLMHNGSTLESRSGMTKWGKLKSLVGDLNPNFTVAYEYGYYSSHAVCLPTFFPDPKKDAAWRYSFLLLLINFLAFTFMLVAYFVMYRRVRTSSSTLVNTSNQERREEQNTRMQRKLTMIVATDFFCWMPVCIMGLLQLGGVDIPKDAYLPTGLILIPINSALNPFLYSNLPDFLWEKLKPARDSIRSIRSTSGVSGRLTSVTSVHSADGNIHKGGNRNVRVSGV